MGMDMSAHLVYGIKLPENFGGDDYTTEKVENIFYPFNEKKPYPSLEEVYLGDCDNPEIFITAFNKAVSWLATPIELEELTDDFDKDDELYKFCQDFNLEYDPRWYLGCYVSY